MAQLFRGSFTYVDDSYVKMEVFSGQGVVGVHPHIVALNRDNGHYARSVFAVGLELHAFLDLVGLREVRFFYGKNQVFVKIPIGFRGSDHARDLVAGFLAFKLFFQPGD